MYGKDLFLTAVLRWEAECVSCIGFFHMNIDFLHPWPVHPICDSLILFVTDVLHLWQPRKCTRSYHLWLVHPVCDWIVACVTTAQVHAFILFDALVSRSWLICCIFDSRASARVYGQGGATQLYAGWCDTLCCSMLQCAAVCCSVLQCVAACWCIVTRWYVSTTCKYDTSCGCVFKCAAVCCSVLQCAAVCCSVLQCVAACWCIVTRWCVSTTCKYDTSCGCVFKCAAVCCSVL